MNRRRFICMDCTVDTGRIGDHYYLRDDVWKKIHPSKVGMLCVLCAESRLGRKLTGADFTDCYINRPNYGLKSGRLLDRLAA